MKEENGTKITLIAHFATKIYQMTLFLKLLFFFSFCIKNVNLINIFFFFFFFKY